MQFVSATSAPGYKAPPHAVNSFQLRLRLVGGYGSHFTCLALVEETLMQFEAQSQLYKLVSSSTQLLGKRYHLHQELVSDDGNTWICDACDRGAKYTINPLSLKAGVDYGSIRRVPWLSKLRVAAAAVVIGISPFKHRAWNDSHSTLFDFHAK